ncbi:hypothetical protein Poli38472_011239 [Pythium oligandrum]|uniref:Uncharacterized protein n=1 Tax=Pythium oligandrum TaxID=41045 RepID=A0A8K1FNS2_PYTOL|nr:hypothetical protein Poli38472_011239 [Pythium oligandrum]|eukprot:TMW67619.1 hypothetical protein Poli38472_011239 [Pythium oligandrum]
MKLAAIIVAATFAAVSAAETAPPCDTVALLKIIQGENGKACATSTGYSAAAAKPVTAANAAQVCPQESCQALFAEIKDAIQTECLALGVTPFISSVVKPTEEACAKFANSPPNCDTATLLKIIQGENGKACTIATGYSAAAAKPVTAANAAQVCPQESCQALFAEIKDAIQTECLALGVTPFISSVVKPTEEACAKFANSPPNCDTATLLKIIQGENGKACTIATGYSAAAAKPVTAANAAQVCPQESCQALFAEIKDAIQTECLALGVTPFISSVVKPTEEACAKFSNSA